jgi:iron-sulfur cluster repair protein YtfE (RIC family)
MLAELTAQHDALRTLMDECEGLVAHLEADPSADPAPLTGALARLRVSLDVHNTFEEELLRPLLLARDPHARARVERMVADHTEEHATISMRFVSPAAAEVRDLIETLRAHLEAEERYLVTPRVLFVSERV